MCSIMASPPKCLLGQLLSHFVVVLLIVTAVSTHFYFITIPLEGVEKR